MNPQTANDTTFLEAVETCVWPGKAFGHREHLRLAWLYLRRHGPQEGYRHIQDTIRRYATALGAAGKYHETMTWGWSALVYRALTETPHLESFGAFLEAHPELLDGSLLVRHYRRETLDSEEARRTRVAPDVSPLPAFG